MGVRGFCRLNELTVDAVHDYLCAGKKVNQNHRPFPNAAWLRGTNPKRTLSELPGGDQFPR
jgi:hypothetical protein